MDILELDRGGGGSGMIEKKVIKKKRQAEQPFKKPEGMNREVFALLYADNKDNSPLIPTDFGISGKMGFPEYGYKKAKANLSLRKVRKWQFIPFSNPARKDGFQLRHWRREVDKNKEYPFAKMNVAVNVPTYSDAEYHQYLQHESWTKAETDYLMQMCKKYDLRFVVIEDRWEKTNRTVEELKDRYYAVCNTLIKQRNEHVKSDASLVNNNTKLQICIFDADHERKRKEQLIKLYNRTPQEVEEEQQLNAELRKIEQRKKEREKKTQDLQKLITAADSTTEVRRHEQQTQSRASTSNSRSNRKKVSSHVKSSRASDANSASLGAPNLETAGIKFPEGKSQGVFLRSSRIKLPSSVGQKRVKAITQLLTELRIEQNPLPADITWIPFNNLRSDMVLLYELKNALSSLEYELQALKAAKDEKNRGPSDSLMPPPATAPLMPLSASIATTPKTPAGPSVAIKEEPKKISEVIDVNATPRKRKAAMESENFMRKISRSNKA